MWVWSASAIMLAITLVALTLGREDYSASKIGPATVGTGAVSTGEAPKSEERVQNPKGAPGTNQ